MIRVVCYVHNNNIGIMRLSNTIFHRNERFDPIAEEDLWVETFISVKNCTCVVWSHYSNIKSYELNGYERCLLRSTSTDYTTKNK